MTYSTFRDIVEDTEEQRRTFFKLIFGPKVSGYICISYLTHPDRKMYNRFFKYPDDLDGMLENIRAHTEQPVHIYYASALYDTDDEGRVKEYVKSCPFVWADLDTTKPSTLLTPPSVVIETSPDRWQALWLMQEPLTRAEAENITQRIYYYHKGDGTDPCWDAGHLLRVPYTPNYKYGDLLSAPLVTILDAKRSLHRPGDFHKYPMPAAFADNQKVIPVLPSEPVESVIERNKDRLPADVYGLLQNPPTGGEQGWSGALWKLLRHCVEAGMRREETFLLANSAACNKYRRDGRPETDLWEDVLRAFNKNIERTRMAPTISASIPDLLTDEETRTAQSKETFVDRYIDWAKTLTDAPVQYHHTGALVILSGLLSGSMALYTTFGKILPNLWFMLLSDTTLTRKTTAMNMAMRLLLEVNSDALLGDDGSPEGIFTAMRDRPRKPSILKRDEFTGLIEAIAHKDYMSGLAEQLTKLYDGDTLKRLLRKEIIEVRDPIFLMYVAGTKTRTQNVVNEDMVMSGFFPRFIIVTAEPHFEDLHPIGPPLPVDLDKRDLIKNELIDMYNHYSKETDVTQDGRIIGRMPLEYNVYLTPEAWSRYNEYERTMMKAAVESGLNHLTPVNDRLCKSTLKVAILLAANRQRGDSVTVELVDLLNAIYYAREWRYYASEIVNGIGKPQDERLIMRMLSSLRDARLGITRSELMSMFMLDARRADLIFATMEQRKLIFKVDIGQEFRYQATN